MASDGCENVLAVGYSTCAPMDNPKFTQPVFPIRRLSAHFHSIFASVMKRIQPRQTISTQGISGNAHVVNVAGDHITHVNDGLGADTYALLESIEERLKVVQDKELAKDINDWLSAPDVSQNFNAALRRRQLGTGAWFLDGAQFVKWKEQPNIVLCIYGAPGCGKTVLCSSIIEAVKGSCTTPLSGWAYFFFDNRNANKGLLLYGNFLRSVLSQLCSRCGGIPGSVKAMYQLHGSGREQPSVKALEETLRTVVAAFDDVYIMVDSLDESGDRIDMLQWIQTVATQWNSAKWHLLVTSRQEPIITSRLECISNFHCVHLKGMGLEKDICMYLEERISLINHWNAPIRALVKTTLIGGAGGMFRWAAMQMDSLQHCMNTMEVREKLNILPKDLEETYEHILAGSRRRNELVQMLHWLAFSARALRVEEVAEITSVDFNGEDGPCYDPDLKYSNPLIALTVCSGLVAEMDGTMKLAHFSVKEYLISERIKTGNAAQFSMNEHLSHSVIAQTCVAYLFIFNKLNCIQTPVSMTGPFPLHIYAAQYLSLHLRSVGKIDCPSLKKLLLKLFQSTPSSESALTNWMRMYEPEPWTVLDVWLRKAADAVAPPLYCASSLGLEHVVERLLEGCPNINRWGGYYGTALRAAAAQGHTEILRLLLDRGANEHLHGGYHGTALHTSAAEGHTTTAELLLDRGADTDFQAGSYGTALQAAAAKGHTEMVELLLQRGANVNIQGGRYGTALQAAAANRHTETVKVLLDRGSDVNIQAGLYGTALQAAAAEGATDVLKILLDCGADVNLAGGEYGNALQAAAAQDCNENADVLLEHDAGVTLQGSSALLAAAAEGYTEIQLLLRQHVALKWCSIPHSWSTEH